MNQSYYDFKLLTHLLNTNQIKLPSDEFKGILEALQVGHLSEVKKSFSPLGKLVARVFEGRASNGTTILFCRMGKSSSSCYK